MPLRRLSPWSSLALLPLVLLACGGDDDGGAAAPEGPVTEITITSPGLSFDIEEFEVEVGVPVTVTYENEDDGVPHNISFDLPGDDDPATEVAQGPVTQELTFTIDEPGSYTYVCDVHPGPMKGTVTAR